MIKSVPWLFLTLLLTPSLNLASSVELFPNIPSLPTQDSNGSRTQVRLPPQCGDSPLFFPLHELCTLYLLPKALITQTCINHALSL